MTVQPFQAVLLAAGLSTRMGSRNKLLLPIDGEPLVRRAASAILGTEPSILVVVTGHESERIEAALSGLPVKTVFNPDFSKGQAGSVRVGATSLPSNEEPVMVALADMPYLGSGDIRSLLAAFVEAGASRLAVPMYQGKPGNPVIVPAFLRTALVEEGKIAGCRRLRATHPEQVVSIPVSSPAFLRDIDTIDAYRRLLESVSMPAECLGREV